MLSSEDYLLIFMNLPGGQFDMDRIRLMKGMFLLTEEAPAGMPRLYDFKPYDWGPFSTGVYRDLDELKAQGLVATRGQQPYETYRVTQLGEGKATRLVESLAQPVRQKMGEVKELTTSLSFLELLEHVYDRHPHYAKRSKLRR